MKFNHTVIESFAAYLPENIVSSEEIEKSLAPLYTRLRLPEGRLELMTGIKERRHFNIGDLPSTLAANAGRRALEKASINLDSIDLLISASVCRNFLEPATASVIHRDLGLSPHCLFFDLSNACLGVLSAMTVAASMIENGQIKRALICSGENGAPLLEQTIKHLNSDLSIDRKSVKKYFANLTIGSGAVAFVLSHQDLAPNAPRLLGGSGMSKSDAVELCLGDGNPHQLMMETDSEALMHAGLELAKSNWQKCQDILAIDPLKKGDIQWVIGHQVGSAHEALLAKELRVDHLPTHRTYPNLGNTGSAALPLTFVDLFEKGLVKKGDRLTLLGIGSGLSSLMLGVQC